MQSGEKVMQRWSAAAVAFMRDASEYGSFYAQLREALLPFLTKNDTVCDAGCGLGYLAQAIAGDCRNVVAADCNAAVINAMQERELPQNLQPICADVFCLKGHIDVLLCSYFGRSEEILRLREAINPKRTIVIQRNCGEHRFSIGETEARHSRQGLDAVLTERCIPYQKKAISLEFGQPFRSFADAVHFFDLYNKSSAAVTEAAVAARLTPIKEAPYSYYLPQQRQMNLYVF